MGNRIEEFIIGFKSQKEWRYLIAIAFFSGGIGAGLFITSVFLAFPLGSLMGLLVVGVIKGGAHLLYLGHPLRSWRVFTQPNTWISRGLIAVVLFLIFGSLYTASLFQWFSWLPWAGENNLLGQIIKIISILSAFFVIIYTGFLMAYSPAIPFWNNSLLPVLFVVYSLLGGVSLIFALYPAFGEIFLNFKLLETMELWLMISTLLIILFYLISMYNSTLGAQESVHRLLFGGREEGVPLLFVGGVLLMGLTIPLLIGAYIHLSHLEGHAAYTALAGAGILELIGGFCFRYSLLRVGVYNPVI